MYYQVKTVFRCFVRLSKISCLFCWSLFHCVVFANWKMCIPIYSIFVCLRFVESRSAQ